MTTTPGDPPDTGPPPEAAEGGTAGGTEHRQESTEVETEVKTTENADQSDGTADGTMTGQEHPPHVTGQTEAQGGEPSTLGTQEQSWSARVRAHRPQPAVRLTAGQVKDAHMLQRHVKQLTATLTEDWTRTVDREWTPEEKEMRDLAMAPAKACCDDSIRGWTGRENATLMAYMAGSLDLPHPPNFVKEIMVGDHRAMLEDYHERYLNVTLTANLPPTVRIARYTPHAELFKELFQANTDKRFGADMMRVFQADVNRIDFDGTRTLHIVFYSRTAANRWVKKTLRFQKAVITLNDTARGPGENSTGTYKPDQLELQYAVRVYDAEKLGLVALSRTLHRFVGAPVLDVEYARAMKTDIYDNRYYTVKFAQVECPEDLKDVTRIEMGRHCITIHHYQTQLRRPCGRCWSPRHGKRKCTVAEGKVAHVRNRYTRVFDGEISKVATSTRADFAADCVETLVEMMKAMQDATSQRVPERLKRRMESVEQPTSAGDDREEINSVANATASTAHTQAAASVGTEAQAALVDAAGYIVHRSKGSKQAANKSRRGQLRGAVELKGVKATRDDSTPLVPQGKAATADFTQSGLPRMEAQQREDGGTRKGTHASKTKANSTKSSVRFTAFQREEARGYYEALADTEESDDADNSDSDHELDRDTDMGMDSDGATTERLALPDQDDPMHPCGDRDMGDAGERLSSGMDDSLTLMPPPKVQPAPVTKRTADTAASSMLNKQHGAVGLADQAGMRREDDIAKTASATKERRRRRHDANRNGLGDNGDTFEEKNGLVQTSLAQYMKTGIQTDTQEMDDVVPATSDSQESFTMGRTHIGTDTGDDDLPIQTGQWLYSFNGQEVGVAANGHCAFLALYASTKNHKQGKLRVTDSTVKQATAMKAQIYATMMTNIRNDVALGIVDPIAECARIFPRHPRHTSKATATAELFAHYAQARDRRVDKSQPTEYWAGVHELRAMAQFLREPLLVLDVAASTDAHVERYLYRDHRLDTGENHESGYVEALKDREASDYLRPCFNLHVLPTFILLKRNDSNFYGVSHGDLYVRWQAEGDQTYADALSDAYEWKATINQLGPSEETVDFATVNIMSDTEEVNALIVKLMPQRDRLDVVHNRRGIPTLDRQNLDYNLDDLLRQEESLIHAAYGADGYAVDFTADNDDDHKYAQLPNRYIRAASGPMVEPAYARILERRMNITCMRQIAHCSS